MSGIVFALLLCSLVAVPGPARAADRGFLQALGLQAPGGRVEAPDFLLASLGGGTLRLRDLRGKVVFLNFWATWCVPCRTEMPDMERLFREFGEKGLVVVAVNLLEGRRAVQGFVDDLKLTFPVVLDADGQAAAAYGVRPIPATFLISRDGIILWRALGARRWTGEAARTYFAHLFDGERTLVRGSGSR